MAAVMKAQVMAVPRSGCINQHAEHGGGRYGRQDGMPQIGDGAQPALQEMRHEENDGRLGKFRRLKREYAKLHPAVRIVRAVQQKHRGQKQRCDAERGKYQSGTVELAVVHVHQRKHGDETDDSVESLLHEERGLRTQTLLGHNGRGREDHDQSRSHQQQREVEERSIRADPLCH